MGRPWKPEEDELLVKMRKDLKSYREIEAVLEDRTYNAIKARMSNLRRKGLV